MSKKLMTPSEDTEIQHPSQDTSSRCAQDTLLRKFGWVIVSRARDKEAMWRKGDRICTETIALAITRG